MLLSLPKSSSNNQKSNHKTFEKHLRRKVCTMHYFDNILSRYNNFVNIYLIIQNFILFLLLFLLIFCFFRQRKRRSDERLYRNYVVLRIVRRVVSILINYFLISMKNGFAEFSEKIKIPVNPMIGVIGVAPAGEAIGCGTPGKHERLMK